MAAKKKKYNAMKRASKKVSEAAVTPYSAEPSIKKNLRLRQKKIDAARAILGTSTETETIETALDLVVFRQELLDGLRAMRGADIEDYFNEPSGL
jgi:hypothetical protein